MRFAGAWDESPVVMAGIIARYIAFARDTTGRAGVRPPGRRPGSSGLAPDRAVDPDLLRVRRDLAVRPPPRDLHQPRLDQFEAVEEGGDLLAAAHHERGAGLVVALHRRVRPVRVEVAGAVRDH